MGTGLRNEKKECHFEGGKVWKNEGRFEGEGLYPNHASRKAPAGVDGVGTVWAAKRDSLGDSGLLKAFDGRRLVGGQALSAPWLLSIPRV